MSYTERDCPICQYPIKTMYEVTAVKCPDCGVHLEVDYDYSFDDGAWRDHTSLRPSPEQEAERP